VERLKDKVAIVTGAALGIGRAIANRMAEAGAAVVLADLHDDAGQALADQLSSDGRRARYWRCDVSREADVALLVSATVETFGGLDVLVNNAGVAGANKPTHELTEAEWDFVQNINTKGVFFGVKHAVPAMRRRGGGSIINLSSIYGLVAPLVEGFIQDGGSSLAEGRKGLDALHPLGHVGEPDDIAWGAVYLASDEAKFVTGSELVIDGGYTAR
jgi:NAD(P)-dependent dehydrogenase (short-subunit alcohol dehydrogenase family)